MNRGRELLRNIIDRVEWKLRGGMSPQEAVDSVAIELGLSKDGRVYKYLLVRARELR